MQQGFRRVGCALVVVAALWLPRTAFAALIQVDWSATVTPNSPGDPSPGSGQLSGSLGIFNVVAAGDTFTIPGNGSLSVVASGFAGGFPNGTYALTRETALPLRLEFLSIGPMPANFSVRFVNNNAGILSAFPNACVVGGVASQCFVGLFDLSGTGADIALASLGLDGSINDESFGAVNFSFRAVPEPTTIGLLTAGLLGIAARRGRKHRS